MTTTKSKNTRRTNKKTVAKPKEEVVETTKEVLLDSETEAAAELTAKEASASLEVPESEPETVKEDDTVEPEGHMTHTVTDETVEDGVVLSTVDDVNKFLTEPNMSVNEKLEIISKSAPAGIKSVAAVLLGYLEDGSDKAANQGPEFTLGLIYNLYTTIKSVIECDDNGIFRTNMDIISLVIMSNNKPGEAFNELRLLRYDYLWSWGDSSLRTHQILTTIMCHLANKSTRVEALKRMDLGSETLQTKTELAPEHIARFVQYYS